jgi:putative ABC transport system permease protein
MGRYGGTDQTVQIFRPDQVMADLLGTILSIQQYVVAAMLGVSVATLAMATLVFWLSLRLRRREIETLFKIGGARSSVSALLASEVALVLLLGLTLAGGLTLIVQRFGAAAIRAVLLT